MSNSYNGLFRDPSFESYTASDGEKIFLAYGDVTDAWLLGRELSQEEYDDWRLRGIVPEDATKLGSQEKEKSMTEQPTVEEINQELLEACKAVVDLMVDEPDDKDFAFVFRKAKSAIAKAEGKNG